MIWLFVALLIGICIGVILAEARLFLATRRAEERADALLTAAETLNSQTSSILHQAAGGESWQNIVESARINEAIREAARP